MHVKPPLASFGRGDSRIARHYERERPERAIRELPLRTGLSVSVEAPTSTGSGQALAAKFFANIYSRAKALLHTSAFRRGDSRIARRFDHERPERAIRELPLRTGLSVSVEAPTSTGSGQALAAKFFANIYSRAKALLHTSAFRRGDSRIARRFDRERQRRAIRELPLRMYSNGFTLIEIVVTIIVMAIAFTSLTVWMVNANKNSVDPLLSMRAAELGQSYLEEILAKRFDENTESGGMIRCVPGGTPACSTTLAAESGETRATYDDVDDYNGLNDNGAVDPLGNVRTEYNNYRVRVTVSYAGTDPTIGLNLNDVKRIDVSVQHSGSGIFVFSAYRGNF